MTTKRKCAQCGGPLPFKARADAIYCSTKCNERARWQRQKSAQGRADRACLTCGAAIGAAERKDKTYCSPGCYNIGYRAEQGPQKSRPRAERRPAKIAKAKKIVPPVKPIPVADAARILNSGFFLGDLQAELELLRKSKTARAEIESYLRAAFVANTQWPSDPAGRASLVLWLLDNEWPAIRFRHPHERKFIPGRHVRSSIDGRQT